MSIKIGTAPDSWGVWFANDARQPPWSQFLDEAAVAGYDTIEIGPYGYLPSEPRHLTAEVQERGLQVSAGFVMTNLHLPERREQIKNTVAETCELLKAVGADYLILIPELYTDIISGERTCERRFDHDAWKAMIEGSHLVADQVITDWDMRVVFHPHADTPVEYEHQIQRFLADTDAGLINVCLDMGHHAYRGGDVVDFIRAHHERIDYLHIKSVDARIRESVEREDLPFAQAVAMNVFVEPEHGVIDFRAVRDVLETVEYVGFAIVEQDLYPCPFDKPLPIARRTLSYLREIGLE